MALTDRKIRNAISSGYVGKLADGQGMFLWLKPPAYKWWRLKYRFNGKENSLALGTYPEVSLADAREARDQARRLLKQRIDPNEDRKQKKFAARTNDSGTFESVAKSWMGTKKLTWSESYSSKTEASLRRHVFSAIGDASIADITAQDILRLLRAIEGRGTVDMAHRMREHIGSVFRYAIIEGRLQNDPTTALKGVLVSAKRKSYPALTRPAEVGQLLRDIDGYSGEFVTQKAMQLLAYCFTRTVEIRFAKWDQFDFGEALWRIPAELMKSREIHLVPLSRQVVQTLQEVREQVGGSQFVLPSSISRSRAISENTVTYALARMGYKGRMTGHGFRTIASTLLNEQMYFDAAIEKQLAHKDPNQTRGAYNRAEYLPIRRQMMQDWADYLDQLKAGTTTAPLDIEAAIRRQLMRMQGKLA